MFHKEEYGRMYSGLKKVKRRRPLATRMKVSKGVAKMESDVEWAELCYRYPCTRRG